MDRTSTSIDLTVDDSLPPLRHHQQQQQQPLVLVGDERKRPRHLSKTRSTLPIFLSQRLAGTHSSSHDASSLSRSSRHHCRSSSGRLLQLFSLGIHGQCLHCDIATRKHILFVFLKVVGLPPNHKYVYQKALLTTELREIFTIMGKRRVGGASATVLANTRVRESLALLETGETQEQDAGVQRRALVAGDADCPICFDPMSGGADTTYCRTTCGYNFHTDCIRHWLREQRNKTCPNCRSPWQDTQSTTQSSPTNREGYVNLGTL